MNTTTIMHRWQSSLQALFPDLHQYQRQALGLFSFGAACARHCHLSRLCAYVPSAAQPHSTRRRLLRLLGNERLDVDHACWQMAAWLARWNAPSARLLLLLDETPLRNDLRVLKVSVSYHRRALPLLWRVYPLSVQRGRPEDMPQQVFDLLDTTRLLVGSYAPQAQVMLLADRGLCWPQLVRWCQRWGWDYVLRAQSQTRLIWQDAAGQKHQQALRDLAPRPGTWWCGSAQVFKKANWLPCQVVAAWPRGADEAWLLVTNQQPRLQVCRTYARRGWQEQSFRDEKSHGFCWQQSHVSTPERMSRLLLILALAQLWLLSLGQTARQAPWRQRLGLTCRATRRLWSRFRCGWHFLLWMLNQPCSVPKSFPCHLALAPPV